MYFIASKSRTRHCIHAESEAAARILGFAARIALPKPVKLQIQHGDYRIDKLLSLAPHHVSLVTRDKQRENRMYRFCVIFRRSVKSLLTVVTARVACVRSNDRHQPAFRSALPFNRWVDLSQVTYLCIKAHWSNLTRRVNQLYCTSNLLDILPKMLKKNRVLKALIIPPESFYKI